jgi:hypothetical protein
MKPVQLFFISTVILSLHSCYIYKTQEPALVKGVDIDQTIMVAKDEIQKKDPSRSLCIWIMRDQVVTPAQAKAIGDLYLTHIDGITDGFNIWHSSWAIANLYRLGNQAVKAELEEAYQKAKKQPERIQDDTKETAEAHINGKELTTGFIHVGGLGYARDHLVVPGDKRYIQSYEEYKAREEKY